MCHASSSNLDYHILRAAQVVGVKEPLLTGTFSTLYAYQGMNRKEFPDCFLMSPAVPGKNEVF